MTKLVRDLIPGTGVLSGLKLYDALFAKLHEESDEAQATTNLTELQEELGDIIEVCYAIAQLSGISIKKLHEKREEKLHRKGGFLKGIVK